MGNPYRQDKIENWISDYLQSDSVSHYSATVREYAPHILKTFITEACRKRDIEPEEIENSDIKDALFKSIQFQKLPGIVTDTVPDLCASFFEFLGAEGRVSDAASLSLFVKTFKGRLTKTEPYSRPGKKLNRNDPCFCGSGKKYKKCCMNMLGG